MKTTYNNEGITYYGLRRTETSRVIDWRVKSVKLASRYAAALPHHRTFPFRYIMFYSRSSSDLDSSQCRYRAYRLQADIPRAWIDRKHHERGKSVRTMRGSILVSQGWWGRPADKPLKTIPVPLLGSRLGKCNKNFLTATIRGISKQ